MRSEGYPGMAQGCLVIHSDTAGLIGHAGGGRMARKGLVDQIHSKYSINDLMGPVAWANDHGDGRKRFGGSDTVTIHECAL